jgi:hypothetical protein
MKRIINVETGEVIDRELNAEEIAQQEIDEANYLAAKAISDAEAQAKAAQKAALLERIGLTADELKTILG